MPLKTAQQGFREHLPVSSGQVHFVDGDVFALGQCKQHDRPPRQRRQIVTLMHFSVDFISQVQRRTFALDFIELFGPHLQVRHKEQGQIGLQLRRLVLVIAI
ncbi:hypothetical protein D3C87_1197240 [compost metagenome]